MTADALRQTRQAEQERQQRVKERISCCSLAGCLSAGAGAVRVALQEQVTAQGRTGKSRSAQPGCMGLCSRGPLIRSSAGDVIYAEVTPDDGTALVRGDRSKFERRVIESDHPFFAG
jgi:bidirectional [NiFe] hydrogenase diaphorase subunit